MADVLVPLEQEGTEAVVARWLVAVGERVEADAPLLELETDKVSVEVPAPVSGVLDEILIAERQPARPGMVLGRIAEDGAGAAPAGRPLAEAPATAAKGEAPGARASRDMSHWHSPAVRKALAESGLDGSTLQGTGRDGRLTRADVDKAVAEGRRPAPAAASTAAAATLPTPPTAAPDSPRGRTIPHDPMRLAIAHNMVKSLADAPQVTAVFEADFSAIITHRARHKAAFAAQGMSLSYTAYIILAAARAMAAVPEVNSRWQDDALTVFSDINIGVGTALGSKGLVVPVIRRVQDLSLMGVAQQLQDVTARARDGQLTPQDMRGGTFTLSNHGVSGSLLAAPIIINGGQSAILGIGKLEKRVVVREAGGVDAIQIRPMAYVTLTIDHRVLDGHQTNAWLSAFVAELEGWPEA